jgi:hypothetical protein
VRAWMLLLLLRSIQASAVRLWLVLVGW